MSGIKSEDFVSSNYTPLFSFSSGKWLSPWIGFQFGYKGFFFNYIGDDIKHHYKFFYGEAVINVNDALMPSRKNRNYALLLHAGPGYFYNYFYDRPNICANIGMQAAYRLAEQIQINLGIAAIIGWDIYQGDEDILPGITVGFGYYF